LGGALVVLIGRYMMNWALDFSQPLPVELVEVGDGSGGGTDGNNKVAGDPSSTSTEAAAHTQIPSAKSTDDRPPDTDLNSPAANPLPDPKRPEGRLLDEAAQTIQALTKVQKQARDELFRALEPPNGAPDRGPSRTGAPDGLGGKGGKLSSRIKRVSRWQIDFRVRDVEDHLHQFDALGVILAVPEPRGGYRVFRDLKHRPIMGKVEDISKMNRIWFIDTLQEHPESVSELARALGMGSAPYIVAFFPQKLEEQMARDEQRFRGGIAEDKIRDKIIFQVRPAAGGYEVVVAENQP
jgi:hypothetical protein